MRKIISLLLVVFLSINLSGCKMITSVFEDKAYGQFNIWAYGEYYSYLSEEAQKFMKTNKIIEINVKRVDSESYIENYLKNSYEGKKEEAPSAVVLKGSGISKVTRNNKSVVRDISNDISGTLKKYSDARIQEITSGKNVYGIPIESKPIILILDEEKLNNYGYSKEDLITWEDVIKIGSDIYSKSKGKDTLFTMTKNQCINLMQIIMKQIKDNDSYFEFGEYNGTFNSAKDLIQKMKKNNVLKISNNNSNSIGIIGSYDSINKLQKDKKEKKYIVTNVPTVSFGESSFYTVEGANLIVTEKDENISGLIEFLKFLSEDKEAISGYKKYNIFPANTSVYNKKVFDNKYEQFNNDKVLARLVNVCIKEESIKDINDMNDFIRSDTSAFLN